MRRDLREIDLVCFFGARLCQRVSEPTLERDVFRSLIRAFIFIVKALVVVSVVWIIGGTGRRPFACGRRLPATWITVATRSRGIAGVTSDAASSASATVVWWWV